MRIEIFVTIIASVKTRGGCRQTNSETDGRLFPGSPLLCAASASALQLRPLAWCLPALRSAGMLDLTLGCLKWAAVGFIVAFFLMKVFEASQIHDDIPKPAFKIRQTKRATLVLSTFAAMLSALVWLLVQKLDGSAFGKATADESQVTPGKIRRSR